MKAALSRGFLMVKVAVAGSLAFSVCGFADVKLPAIFSDHMVLQRSAKTPVWGSADAGEPVVISWNKKSARATADQNGRWEVLLDLSDSPSESFEMAVRGKHNEIRIADVLVGEVWLASGQSNMEWILATTNNAADEIARSANPQLRMFQQTKVAQLTPASEVKGIWQVSMPAHTPKFSAVGYYFGQSLQRALKVPVGIISCNWGGTPSEAWTSPEALRTVPDLKASSEKMWEDIPAFPNRLKEFVANFKTWLKESGREDQKAGDPALFAGLDIVREGWSTVKLPGPIAGPDLPKDGVIWLRKEIDFPSKPNGELRITFGEADRFDAMYWNGKLIKEYTYENFSVIGPRRVFVIPPSEIQAGRNVAAVRIFAPAGPESVNVVPYGAPFPNPSEWLAKAEVGFPDLPANAGNAPVAPVSLPYPQHVAGSIYNGMISPLAPYAFKGVIWYQGEANAGRAFQYRTAFPLLIKDWRAHWNQGDFPFYFCQLANFQAKRSSPGESAWAELREAQSLALELPNTGQAVLIDIGDAGDVHARNKKDVGERLALIALSRDYGKKEEFSGPVYRSMKIEGGKVLLDFLEVGGGLVAKPVPETYLGTTGKREPLTRNSPGSELEGFAICGDDHRWIWANAKIQGGQVAVWSDEVPKPVAVRYAWADNPNGNLTNKTGLPASPFRTDDFPLTTKEAKF